MGDIYELVIELYMDLMLYRYDIQSQTGVKYRNNVNITLSTVFQYVLLMQTGERKLNCFYIS